MLSQRFFRNQCNTKALWRVLGNFGEITESIKVDENTLINETSGCLMKCVYEKDAYGVFTRSDSFVNNSDKPVEVNCLKARFVFEGGEYEVYTQYNDWQSESMGGWQLLVTQVVAGCQSTRTTQDAAPFMVLWSKQQSRGVVFHLLPNCAWEIKVMRIGLGKVSKVVVELGIADYNFHLTIAPGEEVKLPEIICYETKNRLDFDCYKLHNHMHTKYPRRDLPMIYNTWLYRFTSFTTELLMKQAELASEMGLEYFVVDAGWFGRGKLWYSIAGDWEENLTGGFCGRMKEFADYVRSLGMKFGFWLEPERAGADTVSIKERPDFYIKVGDDDSPEGTNYFLDFDNAEAFNWILDVSSKLIEHYGVEYIKFDYNANMFYDVSHTSFLKYQKGLEKYLNELRKRFPMIYLSGCAGGGERTELANYIKYDSFWPTDNESPYENMRMFKEAILRLPPQGYEKLTCIHSLTEYEELYAPFSLETGNPTERLISCADAVWYDIKGVHPSYLEGYHTCSPIEFSCDLSRISPEMRKKFKTHIEQVKENREFWKTAVARIIADTPTVTVYQYGDMSLTKNIIQVMTDKILQDEITVYPVLEEDKMYLVNGEVELNGSVIMEEGIDIKLTNWYEMYQATIEQI